MRGSKVSSEVSPSFKTPFMGHDLTVTQSGRAPWTTPRLTEKISMLRLKTPSQIDRQNVPKAPVIPTVPGYLAKPEIVNLASGVLEGGQNKTQNLPQMTLSLAGGVARARVSERVAKRHLKNDSGRARGLMQGLAGKIKLCGVFFFATITNDYQRLLGIEGIILSHTS